MTEIIKLWYIDTDRDNEIYQVDCIKKGQYFRFIDKDDAVCYARYNDSLHETKSLVLDWINSGLPSI